MRNEINLENEGGLLDVVEEQVQNLDFDNGLDAEDLPPDEYGPDEVMAEIPDFQADLFHYIPLEPDEPREVAIGEAGPGPQTQAARAALLRQHVLDDDNDTRVIVEDPRHGQRIRMDLGLRIRWKELFGDGDIDMDGEGTHCDRFAPFASELDWQIANWVVTDEPGHKAFDRLLAIPGVSYQVLVDGKHLTTHLSGC